MTSFPGSPRLLKGALVAIDPITLLPRVIVFQYNPIALARSVQAQAMGSESGDRTEALRLAGAPVETISIGELAIDATDQLEVGDALAANAGITPQLAALELLLYPTTQLVVANTALMALGTIEVIPPVAPFTLFVWGSRRVLPVRLTELSIEEQEFDVNLNPIRATLSLSLRVLSYSDLPVTHPGYHLFLAHQVAKEALSRIGGANALSAVVAASVNRADPNG